MYGRKSTGGRVELLLLRKHDATTWEVLVGEGTQCFKVFDLEGFGSFGFFHILFCFTIQKIFNDK